MKLVESKKNKNVLTYMINSPTMHVEELNFISMIYLKWSIDKYSDFNLEFSTEFIRIKGDFNLMTDSAKSLYKLLVKKNCIKNLRLLERKKDERK